MICTTVLYPVLISECVSWIFYGLFMLQSHDDPWNILAYRKHLIINFDLVAGQLAARWTGHIMLKSQGTP